MIMQVLRLKQLVHLHSLIIVLAQLHYLQIMDSGFILSDHFLIFTFVKVICQEVFSVDLQQICTFILVDHLGMCMSNIMQTKQELTKILQK
jgi:hypothetical protein